MLLLAVVAQALAVIRGDDDHRLVVGLLLPQPVQEAPDQLVGVGDLAVVGVGELAVRRGRVVGRVRLVEMQEGEEGRLAALRDPAEQRLDRQRAVPLLRPERADRGVDRERVVVAVEAAGDPRRATQHEGRDRGARRPAGTLEARGQCPRALPSVKPWLSRTPWRGGHRPVISDAWAGSVSGQGLTTSSNTTASRANASRRGVRPCA